MWPPFSLEDTELHKLSFITLSTLQSTTSKSFSEEKEADFLLTIRLASQAERALRRLSISPGFCAELRSFFATEPFVLVP